MRLVENMFARCYKRQEWNLERHNLPAMDAAHSSIPVRLDPMLIKKLVINTAEHADTTWYGGHTHARTARKMSLEGKEIFSGPILNMSSVTKLARAST